MKEANFSSYHFKITGKRGNLDQSKERYIWTTPRCLSVPEMCNPTCMQNFDSDTGKITIGPDEYTNMRNCLWVRRDIN